MGRLFWKFFLFFWLAQVVTSTGVGVAIWWLRHDPERGQVIEHRPPPGAFPGEPPPHRRPPPPPPRIFPTLPLVAGSVVSLIFASLLAWYFARPIRNLNRAFKAVADGQLDVRIGDAMGRRDELADLGGQFDHMAERLQAILRSQQRLLHDVSHELRSPLARMQAATDLMRQQPARAEELVERIDRETVRMDALVGELLTLARLDAGVAGRFDEEIALRELLERIVEDAAFEADQKGGTIELREGPTATVRGDEALLHRCIENIVRNAIQHGPERGVHVSISVVRETPQVRIVVADNGPGVPESALEAIFDPFFRCGGGQKTVGYGLGLAIARRILLAHGGSVSAKNRPEGGLAVTVSLPLSDASSSRGPSSFS